MKTNYTFKKQLENEITLLYAMCGKEDREYFKTRAENADYKDFTRLMCICMAFDLKAAMLRIMGDAERFGEIDKTINYIVDITYDYALVKGWVEDFIDGIENPALKIRAIGVWGKKKRRFDKNGFELRNIFNN